MPPPGVVEEPVPVRALAADDEAAVDLKRVARPARLQDQRFPFA